MKKIMLYNTKKSHAAIWPNMISLKESFQYLDNETVLCDFDDIDSLQHGYGLLAEPQEIYFTIGMNDIGMYLPTAEGQLFPVYQEIWSIQPYQSLMQSKD